MKKFAGIIALALALAAAGIWVAGGRAIAAESIYPAERAVAAFQRGFAARARALWRRDSLAKDNIELRHRLALLECVRDDNERLAAENARLRVLLDYPGVAAGSWVAAPVLSRNGTEGVRGFLRVGKGSLDGIKPNAPVISPEGLVGLVGEVTAHTATVRLISDPAMRIACVIETAEEDGPVRGIVSGAGSQTVFDDGTSNVLYFVNPLRLRHVKREASPPEGARLVTSGLGGIFPPGLAIGYLSDGADLDETKLEREGVVAPAVDFAGLEDVFIRRES